MQNEYTSGIDVRVRDLDRNDHVNHAVFVSYIEYARNQYWWDVLGDNDINRVVANLEVEYRKPIQLHDEVEIAIRLGALRNTSIALEYDVYADGEIAAVAETVQVRIDDAGNPKPLPDEFRNAIHDYHFSYIALR